MGRVLSRTFAVFGRDLPLLLGIAILVFAPSFAFKEFVILEGPRLSEASDADGVEDAFERWFLRTVPIRVGWRLLDWTCWHFATAFVTVATYARLRGRRPSFGESVRGGLSRVGPVLRVALPVSAFSVGLSTCAELIGLQLLRANRAVAWLFLGPVTDIPIALLLSPFWVAVPAAVVEPPRRLLRRSLELTRGHRLAICAVVLVLHGIEWGVGQLLWLGFAWSDPVLAIKGIWWTKTLLVGLLFWVAVAVCYYELRLGREGVDAADLEQVFA